MEFSNLAIDPGALPKAEVIELHKVEPSYWRVLQWRWLISSLALLFAGALAIYFIKKLHSTQLIIWAAVTWLVITVTRYLLMRLNFTNQSYALREKDMLYQSGWIIRGMHICPFNRIQHCSVSAGPIERQYGLASISLYTAGSDGSDFTIPGLTEEKASSLREFIMQKIKTDEQPAN